jgi:hypothetical protein
VGWDYPGGRFLKQGHEKAMGSEKRENRMKIVPLLISIESPYGAKKRPPDPPEKNSICLYGY